MKRFSAWLIFAALTALTVAAEPFSLREKAESFWKDLSIYPAILVVVVGSIFVCCCVLPKLLRIATLVVILGGTGYVSYKAIKDKF